MITLEAKLKRIVLGEHEDGTPAYLEKRELNEILTAVTEWAEEAIGHLESNPSTPNAISNEGDTGRYYRNELRNEIKSNLNSTLREKEDK